MRASIYNAMPIEGVQALVGLHARIRAVACLRHDAARTMTDPLRAPARKLPSLADLRVQIDALDQQLLDLLNQRAHVAEQVGEVKKREGTPFFRPDRVAQVIEKMQGSNPGPLKSLHVAAIWREIMSACLRARIAPTGGGARPRRHLLRTGGRRVFRRRGRPGLLRQLRRSLPCDRGRQRRSTAWSASRTPPKAWSPAHSTCSCIPRPTWWAR